MRSSAQRRISRTPPFVAGGADETGQVGGWLLPVLRIGSAADLTGFRVDDRLDHIVGHFASRPTGLAGSPGGTRAALPVWRRRQAAREPLLPVWLCFRVYLREMFPAPRVYLPGITCPATLFA